MKKSKKVLLSAAIAAAIMGSVSLPQIQAANIGSGVNLKATSTGVGVLGEYDVKTTDKYLNTTLATQEGLKNVNSELAGKANSTDIANQVSTKEVVADNVNAINVNASNLSVSGKAEFNGIDGVSIKDSLNVGDKVQANKINAKTITADEANVVKGNISNLSVSGKAEFNGTDGVSIKDSLNVGDKVQANKINAKTITADEANVVKGNISNLSVSGKAEFNGTDGVSISDDLNVGGHVEANTINATGAISSTQINGTTVNADKVDTNKLTVGNIDNVEQAITDNKTAADKAQATADAAQKDATKANDKADAALKVTGNGVLYNHATNLTDGVNQNTLAAEKNAKDIEQNKQDIKANASATNKAQATADAAQKDATKANYKADAALKVTGNGVLYNHATNLTDGVNQNTLAAEKNAKDIETEKNNRVVADNELSNRISDNKVAITNETNDRVAADTVLSNRISDNSSAIQSLRHDVSDLGTEIDNVGAISAALAGLHPLDWNGSGSKFQLSAAAGTYDGKQAMALGGFYHPNRNMLLSLGVSSSLGSDRKTAGNVGITFRVGKGSNGTVSDDVAERLAAMDQKISQLESQNQKLTSILAIVDPSLTKEFPDVPANHWAYEAVSKLAGNGIVEGYPDGDFHGDRTMTRYEMAQVIYKALKKGGTVDQKLVKEFNKEIEAVKANDAQ
ncbi:S-layer homology domain-containing protein [uncultured Megasphaera sp.]|uniref:YadA-like family protein n=1 Tax=uncultured Megasphaera sp. TaxID=165188 RepID=UPI00261B796A|nr:S-layer homology domain-containing protein [uncultured Megasphaera sp.]